MKLNGVGRIFLIYFLPVIFSACSDKYKTVHEQFIEVNKSDLRNDTLIRETVSNSYFSRLNKPGSFGRMCVYQLSKEQEGKEFWVVFSGKTRSNYAQSNATITVTGRNKNHEQIYWLSLFLKGTYSEQNKWCYFKDSIHIEPAFFGKKYNSITCVAFLPTSTAENFDIDTLHVTIKVKI